MTIAGVRLWAWCGMDTLIFTHVLNTPITITSTAPDSGEVVRLHASPSGVTDITPPGAVITQRVPSDDQVDLSTHSTIWGTFCHHNHFFPDRTQAERWAAGRDDIVILSIEDGFAAARDMAGALLGYEPERRHGDRASRPGPEQGPCHRGPHSTRASPTPVGVDGVRGNRPRTVADGPGTDGPRPRHRSRRGSVRTDQP